MKIFHGYFLGNLFGSLWLPMARVQILLVIYIEWENGENRSAVVQTVDMEYGGAAVCMTRALLCNIYVNTATKNYESSTCKM